MNAVEVRTSRAEELVDITARVQSVLQDKLGSEDGICLLFCPHTTAGLTVNECADPAVRLDMVDAFEHLVQEDANWRHLEGNSPAHVKTTLTGSSVLLPIVGGEMKLGRWQGVFLCEFDGPRTREVWVQILS
jgi:secondary thiamine-phosphate synthase enzyme